MMTNDLKSLVPAQEKLEWVTPKISLEVVGDTTGNTGNKGARVNEGGASTPLGPS